MACPMAGTILLRLLKDSRRGLFLVPIFLAFGTSFFIYFSISSTLKLHIVPGQTRLHVNLPLELSKLNPEHVHPLLIKRASFEERTNSLALDEIPVLTNDSEDDVNVQESVGFSEIHPLSNVSKGDVDHQGSSGNKESNSEVFHDITLFEEDYKEMNKSLKIYVYPHTKNDRFANILLPVDYEPGGNYASESYFKKSLFRSHFITNDPSEADLFYMPFSIAGLRHDKRVGVGGIKKFIKNYVDNISVKYPYWNRSGGADHFYVACHSVGRTAMEKAVEVKLNAIQVVCSSSYFLSGYVTHKDASIPQIWPRKGEPPIRAPSQRKKLAFYAGAMNSRVREFLVNTFENDSGMSIHRTRLKSPYSEALLGSKYCIHAKGFEVNTARIGDALYYGCVPVVLADHYDLPYADILNWNSFSLVLSTADIPLLKKVLEGIEFEEYLKLQNNVMKVQKHFQWHNFPVDFDAFHMVMYELWLRRSHVRIPVGS
ncbi:probable glycosyltransferase At5g03795 [Olea europaea var. sylvestris]|uniref:probable glycosyltransferase At5g03795 n=1 Tax=Olea europaea var. sylvestris TaxID=158386 RepID=UPI000C1D1B3D|nr:probable glycosyltransferase At5g03795 [Olea europaea var. sylvestris]